MTLIKGISGLRGIVNKGLNLKVVSNYAYAFSILQPNGKILVARDARSHGEKFLSKITDIFNYYNICYDNYDIIPTPTAQFLIHHLNYCGGIVVTASHNPIDWNGMKFIDNDGCFLSKNKIEKLNIIYDELNEDLKESQKENEDMSLEGIEKHIKHTCDLSIIDKNKIIKNKYNVAVDAANGAASIALPLLLEKLGCNVHKINCTPNGTPSRGMEPIKENLEGISNYVRKNNLDIGFATDPDGDRLAIIDNYGNPISEEITLPICVLNIINISSIKSPIITNLSTSMMLEHVCKSKNLSVIRTAVGEINVVEEMKKHSSIIGGEGNGGIILKESHLGRDSIVGAAIILNHLSLTSKTIKEICKDIPQTFMIKEKISIYKTTFKQVKNKLKKLFKNVETNEVDGIKFIWNEKWAHIRPSNTEPIIRIYIESYFESEITELMNAIRHLIENE